MPTGLRSRRCRFLLTILLFALVRCNAPETSVKPGINDRFKGDMKVDEWVVRFESESREVFHHRDVIIDAMGIEPGMAVADIGAGTGFYSFAFADRVGESGRVYAVDIARPFLDHIEAQASERGLGNVEVVQCPEDATGLPRRSIDVAFICDTYHHFEYPRSTMRSLYRAMRPGGRVYLIDFIRYDVDAGRNDAKWATLPQDRRSWIAGHVRCDRQTVIAECRAAGFESADAQPDVADDLLSENYMLTLVRR